jgi:hypothetical protein
MNRFIQKLFITILFLFFAFLSHAQDATTLLLEGTIGKARIMMELTLNGSDIWGQYYYKKHKKTIELEGKYLSDKSIELVYEHWGNKEVFTLKDIGNENTIIYTGTWQQSIETENGTTVSAPLAVKLTMADVSKIPVQNTYVKHANLSDYNYSRLADIKLVQDSVQKINAEFSVTWLRDTITGFAFIRVNKNASVKGIDSLNYFLETLQFSEILSYLDCNGSEYTSGMNGVYIRGHMMSFSIFNSYECGGAHPDFGSTGYTFNMETGKQMLLTDFLFFGKTEADYSSKDSYKLGSDVMGPNIVKLLNKLYPEEMKKPEDEDDPCDYSSSDVWDYSPWYLTENGLYLYPYFYRYARCCDGAEFSVIPYKTLEKYKNPKVVIPMTY